VIAGGEPGKFFDRALMFDALWAIRWPISWGRLLLIIVFSGQPAMTPVRGRIDLLYYFPNPTGFMLKSTVWRQAKKGAFISTVAASDLADDMCWGRSRLAVDRHARTRSLCFEILARIYIRTARAKDVSGTDHGHFHALRNALSP